MSGTVQLKVASYNIRKGIGSDRRRSPERILDVLLEIDADIIALQEADRRFGSRERVMPDWLLAERSDWRAVNFGMRAGSMGWHGNAILVRSGITVDGCAPMHIPSLEPRGAVSIDARTPLGAMTVVGMHLDLSGLWRRRQAAAIANHLATMPPAPAVLMGDLNEWSLAGGCLRDFGQRYRIADTGPSFHARRPIGRLDRIMVTPDLMVAACGVHASTLARRASDHLPIWAILTRA